MTSGVACGLLPGGSGGFSLLLVPVWRGRLRHILTFLSPAWILCDLLNSLLLSEPQCPHLQNGLTMVLHGGVAVSIITGQDP